MKNYLPFLVALLFCACQKEAPKQNTPDPAPEAEVANNEKEALEVEEETPKEVPFGHTIGEARVWRKADPNQPDTWASVTITNISGHREAMRIGEKVQVFPLRTELPTLELEIVSLEEQEGPEESTWTKIELEEIQDKAYWTIASLPGVRSEYPSEVIVLYPVVEGAVLLDPSTLKAEDLPVNPNEEVNKEMAKAAIDFDGDGAPDGLVLDFCCRDRTPFKITECDYNCGEEYLKVDGAWNLISSSEPL